MAQQKIADRLVVFRQKVWVLFCVSVLFLGVPCGYAAETPLQDPAVNPDSSAGITPDSAAGDTGTADTVVAPPYEYKLSARPDPFKPFIAPQTVNPNELVDDDNRELTGMQLFEPRQLTLVAVMDTPRGRLAMVEDVTKKGYLLKEGVLIGRHGEVTEIRRDQVIVTETAHTRGGEEVKTLVSMKLKRDGEGE